MSFSPLLQSILTGLPREPGTYALLLRLPAARELEIGALGRHTLSAGTYIYVGSALGAGGLRSRIAHHARIARRPRWHLDYVRPHADLYALWFSVHASRLEDDWARTILALDGATVQVPGFGASDRPGVSHLFHFTTTPILVRFTERLGPAHPPVRCLRWVSYDPDSMTGILQPMGHV